MYLSTIKLLFIFCVFFSFLDHAIEGSYVIKLKTAGNIMFWCMLKTPPMKCFHGF